MALTLPDVRLRCSVDSWFLSLVEPIAFSDSNTQGPVGSADPALFHRVRRHLQVSVGPSRSDRRGHRVLAEAGASDHAPGEPSPVLTAPVPDHHQGRCRGNSEHARPDQARLHRRPPRSEVRRRNYPLHRGLLQQLSPALRTRLPAAQRSLQWLSTASLGTLEESTNSAVRNPRGNPDGRVEVWQQDKTGSTIPPTPSQTTDLQKPALSNEDETPAARVLLIQSSCRA